MNDLSNFIVEANVNAQIIFGVLMIAFLLFYIFFGPERGQIKQKR